MRFYSFLFLFSLLFSLFSPSAAKADGVSVGSGTLKMNGLLQIWFVHDPAASSQNTFRLRRSEIKLSGKIIPKIEWGVMVDPAKELKVNGAAVDPTSKILQDLYFQLGFIPRHQISLGQFKIPVSEEGRRSSSLLDTIERSVMSRSFGDKRDIGIQIAGQFSRWEYRVGLFNGEGSNQTDKNDQKDYTGLLIFKPIQGLEVGGVGYRGSAGSSASDKNRYGAEIRYQYRSLSIKGEALWAKDGGAYANGWQVFIGYFLIPKRLQGVVRFEGFDPDQGRLNDKEHDLTIGVNGFLAGRNAKIQMNYVHKEFQPSASGSGTNQLALAMQVAF